MKIALFWIISLGMLSIVGAPVAGLLLGGSTADWLTFGLIVASMSWGTMMLWALREIRRDRCFSLSDRGAARRFIFFTKLGFFDFGIQPWLYLRDRVHGRDTSYWARDDAIVTRP